MLFWPFITTALLVVALHVRIVANGYFESKGGLAFVAAAFVSVLLLLALVRARVGARLGGSAALLLCAVFALGLFLGGQPHHVDSELLRWDPTQTNLRRHVPAVVGPRMDSRLAVKLTEGAGQLRAGLRHRG